MNGILFGPGVHRNDAGLLGTDALARALIPEDLIGYEFMTDQRHDQPDPGVVLRAGVANRAIGC